jgi:hypothetical protein
MSLRELLTQLSIWADAQALPMLLVAVLWGVLGTVLARIARGGRSDQDGRLIASVVIGGAVLWLVLTVVALAALRMALNQSLLDINVLLLLAPLACVLISVLGIRQVFPLNGLATVRTLSDVVGFAVACLVVLWMLSKFRGWGVMFLGGLSSLLVIGVLALLLLRVLYRRAFK